jgi:hypothetical protein
MRRALWVSVVYNFAGAFLFAFPASPFGRLSGLPDSVPAIYSSLVALFVALFAGAYCWLAMQPEIDRPMVALGAIGKAGAFTIFVALWMMGRYSGLGVISGSGDLILAAIFTWWLVGGEADANRSR